MSVLAQTPPFAGPDVQWYDLAPLLALVGGGIVLMVLAALLPGRWPRGGYAVFTAVVAGVAGTFTVLLWNDVQEEGPRSLVGGALGLDGFTLFVTFVICVAVLISALFLNDYLRRVDLDGVEVYALMLMSAAGGVIMASANDLIVLFLGFEALSLALYVLAASQLRRVDSQESGLKYFVLGGFSSAFLLYGIALVYGATGTTNLAGIVDFLDRTVLLENGLMLAGIALLLVGLAFKIAAVPFHMWTPDVYQGAPTPVTGFMASAAKAAAFAALLRVVVVGFAPYEQDWQPVIWVLAAVTVVVGAVLAVVQTNVKRMLAYSSISHAGFILVGLEAAARNAGEADSGPGVPSVMVYMLAYAVLVVGTFAVVSLVARRGDMRTDLDSFRGLGRRHAALALALTVLLVAQAGVPFTSGFIAKFGVIRAGVDEQSYALAIIAMLSSVVAAFLYLRIMVSAWIQEAPADDDTSTVSIPLGSGVAITAAVAFTLVVGLFPEWLLDIADSTVQFAR